MSFYGHGSNEQAMLDAIEAITDDRALQAKILADVLAHVTECAYEDSKHE